MILASQGMIREWTEKGVAIYKLPERLEIIDEIPRNPVGKVLKKELRADIVNKLESEGSSQT